jgi:hypothetical protein
MLNIVLLFAALCLVVGQPPPGPRGRGPPLPNQILPLVTSLSTTTVQVIDPRINRTPTTFQPPLPNDPPVLLPLHPSLPLFLIPSALPINPVNINRTPQLIQQQPVIVPSVLIPPLRFLPLSDSVLTTTSSVRVNVTQSSIISSSPKLKKGVDKRSRTTMPVRSTFTRKDTYDKALARYLNNLEDATPEQIARAQAHNTVGNAAYNRALAVSPQNRSEEESHRVIVKHERRSEAKALSKSNPDALTPSQQRLVQYQIDADNERSEAYIQRRQNPGNMTERQHEILVSMDRVNAERSEAFIQRRQNPGNMTERQHEILVSMDRVHAERSEAFIQRRQNPGNMTERQHQILVSMDRVHAERSEAFIQRRQNPGNMTERQHQIVVASDRVNAERAIQIAADRRLAQETFLGMQLPVHTPVQRASMLQNIINALQSFFSANPFAAFNVGSISINAIEYLRLTDAQVLHRMMAADGQSLSEWGRSGTYHPLLRSSVNGSYTTIPELERRGGFCIPLHILLDPSSNCLERDLQLLHREHNLYEHGSILNGGLVASGNHWTQTGRLSFLFLTVIPDRRIFFRFPEGIYQPWPLQLPAVTLGQVPVPLPPLPERHFGETFLHALTNPTEMLRLTRQDIQTQVERNHIPPSLFDDVPVLPITRGLRVSEANVDITSDRLLMLSLARLGVLNFANNHFNSDLLVIPESEFLGISPPSEAAAAALQARKPVTSLTNLRNEAISLDPDFFLQDNTNGLAQAAPVNTQGVQQSLSLLPRALLSGDRSLSTNPLSSQPLRQSTAFENFFRTNTSISSIMSLPTTRTRTLPTISSSRPRPPRTTTMFEHFTSTSSTGISSTPSLPSTLPRDRTGIDNSPLQRVTRPIVTVDFDDDDDDDDVYPVQPIRQIPVVLAHPQDQYPRLSLSRSITISLQDFMALTTQQQEAMNADLPRVPFNFDDIDTDNDDDDDNTLGPVAPLHPHPHHQQQQLSEFVRIRDQG